ncbi:hypothetical protein [Kitasatospora sp. GP82]|uniref:hypothetical protein n=1 Tax=Kitasatospora sp. GP82 TaxID=3035089 RepID=UPI0024748CCE|nr:hypothetical protein [Kitasatospora sp. GP82]MDH6125638.1 hypothetical protein [Kitasatospora sp. GP82]
MTGVPALIRGLFDDAAIFPPGDLPLPEALPAHRAHRSAWYAEAVGPFLCGVGRLGELAALHASGTDLTGLRVVLVAPGGVAQLGPALKAVTALSGLELVGVEVAATSPVREVAAALDAQLPPGVPAAVEIPRDNAADALDALAGTPYRAKYRTGGLSAEAFPSEAELAAFLSGCAERGLGYKCTAGLHNAVRHTDPVTGFEHHGFLNVLLAADRPTAAAELLAERSGEVLATAAAELTDTQVAGIRRSFTAFGTCSIAEPLADLAELGLLEHLLENR